MTAEIEHELQNLKEQLALLQTEHAKTRAGWLYLTRNTGILLAGLGIAMFVGVLKSHAQIDSNPVTIALTMMSLLMLAFGLWLLVFSIRRVAERLMKVAPRQ